MPNILLIEDNPGDALLIREMYRDADVVGEEYKITRVDRVSAAIQILRIEHSIDLILSDMSLPDSQGLETLNQLAAAASELPVIFMTGTNDEVFVKAAIKAGAQDYLVKGHIDAQLLSRATTYAIERKKTQNRIERALIEADSLAQRTALLRQQKRQLIALNKTKDEFISLSSHQLRTPATSVKQYLGMILEGYAGDVPDNLRVFIRTAYDSNERQLTIINDLLKTARLDSGRYNLLKKPHDICELTHEVIEDYMPMVTVRKQKIVASLDKDCRANVDAVELKIAIANLVENASKYSPAGTTIKVKATKLAHTFKLEVSDMGVGIPKAELSKVFDKFTRLDNALSDTVNGNGLGLYFVKRIVKIHGGKITVKSEIDKGSTFTMILPV